jgi:hypothetical protein
VNILATSNKDFKIKNGLIVEGDSATVNGNDVLTSASSIDDLDDVSITTPADTQVLAYEAETSLWKNINLSGGSSVTVSSSTPESPSDGSVWLDTDGTVQPASADLRKWVQVATAAQTTFTGEADGSGSTLAYTPGNEQVFLNGVQLVRDLDYTANNGTSIVLAAGAAAGDVFQVITLPPVAIVDAVMKNVYEAKGDLVAATADSVITRLAVGATGTFLKADSSEPTGLVWETVDALPTQTSNEGKFLTTDGTDATWENIPVSIPAGGAAGQFLSKTSADDYDTEWADVDTAAISELQAASTFAIKLNEQTITANYSIPVGYNGVSAGPITIDDGVVVTVPSGSSWSIV